MHSPECMGVIIFAIWKNTDWEQSKKYNLLPMFPSQIREKQHGYYLFKYIVKNILWH
jgi:hypothetical protein